MIRSLTAAAAAHPACRAHASFSSSLWQSEGRSPASVSALSSLPSADAPAQHEVTCTQLQLLQSVSSLLFSDARARDAAASLRLRLLLSSSPHAIITPPSRLEDQLQRQPLSSSDALARALAVTRAQLQRALLAAAPSTKHGGVSAAGGTKKNSGGGSCSATSVRTHIIGAVPDRGGRPHELNDRTVARDVSSANAALKGQVGFHANAKSQQLPVKRQLQSGGKSGRKR
jgi:hypothetical protein